MMSNFIVIIIKSCDSILALSLLKVVIVFGAPILYFQVLRLILPNNISNNIFYERKVEIISN